jgi:hypothetical protein
MTRNVSATRLRLLWSADRPDVGFQQEFTNRACGRLPCRRGSSKYHQKKCTARALPMMTPQGYKSH